MPAPDVITLHLTASGIDSYCRDLARRAPTLEKRVTALDALLTFISTQADAGVQARAEFTAIRQTLLAHFEQARVALLAERAQHLHQALMAHHLPHITSIYNALSRDAFWTLLRQVEQQLDASALSALHSWAQEWLSQAQQSARLTSRYPDAIDFAAASIEPAEYLAMTDLCRYFGIQV